MSDSQDDHPVDAGTVKYLRLLVTVLTAVMIVGFLVIVTLFVIRFSGLTGARLPDEITLPGGASPMAFTRGPDWYAVVTDENEILIFDLDSKELRQTIAIEN